MFLENGGFFMCSFNRIDIFWPNMGMTAGGFSWKNWKITWEQCVLREWTYFWQNMGIKAFFRELTFFEKISAWEQRFFLWNIRKKRAFYSFFGP